MWRNMAFWQWPIHKYTVICLLNYLIVFLRRGQECFTDTAAVAIIIMGEIRAVPGDKPTIIRRLLSDQRWNQREMRSQELYWGETYWSVDCVIALTDRATEAPTTNLKKFIYILTIVVKWYIHTNRDEQQVISRILHQWNQRYRKFERWIFLRS